MPPGEPFYALGQQLAIDLPGARAMFTTRRGGHSRGPYESLNLGRLTQDDPHAVQRNREAVAGQIRVSLTFVRQVHGARVAVVDGGLGRPAAADGHVDGGLGGPAPAADGQVTAAPGVGLVALTADCLPIAVAGGGAVAMLHAGWRGLHGDVVAAGVAAVRRLGAPGRLAAAIGPGAGPCCYEVGPEVHRALADAGSTESAHRRGSLDLKAIARRRLEAAGVGEVHDIGVCTICSSRTEFFSHRRDRGITGRQAGIAWLT